VQKKKVIDSTDLKSSLRHNPFDRLKSLVGREGLPPSRPAPESLPKKEAPASDPDQEEQLFHEAMEGVHPLAREHVVAEHGETKPAARPRYVTEDEAISQQLARLVDHGEGFIVSDTPEYIEGTGYNVCQEFARRLHRGDFSIQAHIDLHGLNAEYAKEAFESFLKSAVNSGKNAVLIIHGRGLSSPGEAILKNKVREWLSQSYWLKRVVAYTSAQSHDGGAGATYVLLRHRPVSKKSGKRKSSPGT